jgi:hypothetical protein
MNSKENDQHDISMRNKLQEIDSKDSDSEIPSKHQSSISGNRLKDNKYVAEIKEKSIKEIEAINATPHSYTSSKSGKVDKNAKPKVNFFSNI